MTAGWGCVPPSVLSNVAGCGFLRPGDFSGAFRPRAVDCPAPANIKWVGDYYDATSPHSEEGGYINFAADDDQGRAPANFGKNYARLVQATKKYDPHNMFRINQNIRPQPLASPPCGEGGPLANASGPGGE